MHAMIDLWTAFDRVMKRVSPLEAEEVALEEAVGRAAAVEVGATRNLPGYRRAMMDGSVCRGADLANEREVSLKLTGAVHVGTLPHGTPGPDEAWSITTGGPVPDGADQVLPIEMTRRQGQWIRVLQRPSKSHVAEADEDVRKGEVLQRAGEPMTALSLGGLAAAGIRRVSVTRRPRVLVLSTGDEVLDAQQEAPAGQINNVNGPVLVAELRSIGIEPLTWGVLHDDPELLEQTFGSAMQEPVDVVLSTGGVSVGPHDYVPHCWRKLGAERIVAGVDVKPGWPLYVGQLDGRWLVGLSGSPTACMATYHLLVRPLLLRLAGHANVVRPLVRVALKTALEKRSTHTRLLWASISGETATDLTRSDEGKLTAIGRANAMLIVPPGLETVERGQDVLALRLDRAEDRSTLALDASRLDIPAVCMVGRSNSGKTTAATGLIRRFRARGIDVVTIKHAAHGFQLDPTDSDSGRMLASGAGASWVSGPGEIAMTQCLSGTELEASDLVRMALATRRLSGRPMPGLVLLEGFSDSALPRVLVGPPKHPDVSGGQVLATLVEGFSEADLDRLTDELVRQLSLEM